MEMMFGDTLTNLVSGMGTDKDKVQHGHFRHHWLGKGELDAMYQTDWLAGTIIDAPCDDMTREWREWKGGPRQVQAIEQSERKFQVRQKVNQALKLARLFGGSAILIGDGSEKPEAELNVAGFPKGGLRFLHVLSRWEITCGPINRDPLSPYFGEPLYYQVGGAAGGALVHPSRVVRLIGQARLETTWGIDGWGMPTLQRVYDAIKHAAGGSANLAAMTNEAKVDVIKVPDLTKNVANAAYRGSLLTRFGLANTAKSLNNMLLLDAAEDWQQKQIRFGEMPAVVRLFLEITAGAANIPLTRLLGTSAKGLNATGDGDVRHYYDTLHSRQEIELRPALERLDDVLVRNAIGSHPANLDYEFKPLWQMTDAEKAAIALQKAQTTQIYANIGIVPQDVLRTGAANQVEADDIYPGFAQLRQDATEAKAKAEPLNVGTQKPVDPGKVNENIASNLGGLKE